MVEHRCVATDGKVFQGYGGVEHGALRHSPTFMTILRKEDGKISKAD